MIAATPNEIARFTGLLEIVRAEGLWLQRSDRRLFSGNMDSSWLASLESDDAQAEMLEAFVSRFGRMQDTIGDKLIPSFLRILAERPGGHIDNLQRAEKLGLIESAQDWLDARNLRNKLVHEYAADAGQFIDALHQAHAFAPKLIAGYHAIREALLARAPGMDVPRAIPP